MGSGLSLTGLSWSFREGGASRWTFPRAPRGVGGRIGVPWGNVFVGEAVSELSGRWGARHVDWYGPWVASTLYVSAASSSTSTR